MSDDYTRSVEDALALDPTWVEGQPVPQRVVRAAVKQAMYDRLNEAANPHGMTVEVDLPSGLPAIFLHGDVVFGPALPDFVTVWLQGYACAREGHE